MNEVIYQLSYLLPYLIIFPFLSILLMVVLWLLSKRSITNNNISFYGLFMNLKFIDILALSFLFIYYFLIIESFFITTYTLYSVVLFVIPVIMFNILSFSGNIFKVLFSLGNAILIFIMLYFKNIFYSYIVEISSSWYIVVLFIMLCIFIFLYATYIFLNSLLNVLKRNKFIRKKESKG